MYKHSILFSLIFSLFFSPVSLAQTALDQQHTPDKSFMQLYYDFTGENSKSYPKGKVNAALALRKTTAAINEQQGPLILIMGSTIYIYDANGKLLKSVLLRTNPATGFFELTAISHIGPALAYYAKAKANGYPQWKAGLQTMLDDIKAVRKANSKTKNNWLDELNAPAYKPYKNQIKNMVDYACSFTGNYISDVLSGKKTFNLEQLNSQFLSASDKTFPIPYNNVMVATFMLVGYESIANIYQAISQLNLDWPNAKVLIRTVAGGNVSAGLSESNNWMVGLLTTVSKGKLTKDRIYITPYADVKSSLGQAQLPKADLSYYSDQIWGAIYNRTHIAKLVFTNVTSTFVPGQPAIPGDYGYTKADNIDDFVIRMKFSLDHASEMLSNTVGFWLVGEFGNKNGQLSKIQLPGFTTGFPKGINAYPKNNPAIN